MRVVCRQPSPQRFRIQKLNTLHPLWILYFGHKVTGLMNRARSTAARAFLFPCDQYQGWIDIIPLSGKWTQSHDEPKTNPIEGLSCSSFVCMKANRLPVGNGHKHLLRRRGAVEHCAISCGQCCPEHPGCQPTKLTFYSKNDGAQREIVGDESKGEWQSLEHPRPL